MEVKGKIEKQIYKDLLNYAFQKCDVISLTKYYDQHYQETKETMKTILSESHYTVNDIVSNYSKEFIEEMYSRFVENPVIFDDEFKSKYEPNGREENKRNIDGHFYLDNRYSCIWHALGFTIYNVLSDRWLELYKSQIIFARQIILHDNLLHSMVYHIKLEKDIKQDILNKNSIYDWCFPTALEDLCFYKNGCCWLNSVAHEEICNIFCENEEEYEYLKLIGIEFIDDMFVPTPKEEFYHEEY